MNAILNGVEVDVLLTDAETNEALVVNPDNVDATIIVPMDDLTWIVR